MYLGDCNDEKNFRMEQVEAEFLHRKFQEIVFCFHWEKKEEIPNVFDYASIAGVFMGTSFPRQQPYLS